MRPCDCKSMEDVRTKLNESGLRDNDDSIEVTPNSVTITLSGRLSMSIPMRLFKRFAEWYLEDQDTETQETQAERGLKDILSFCNGRIKTGVMTPAYKDVRVLVRQHINAVETLKQTD